MSNNKHVAEELLQEALTLAKQELEALQTEEGEGLEKLANKRATLMRQAWEQRAGFDESTLSSLLSELHTLHQEIMAQATDEHRTLQKQLITRKKQSGYFANAYNQEAYNNKAFYMNKTS